jgi:hypothetical protein
MKLSQEQILEIATMTRRRMIKLTGMAALGMAFPAAALGGSDRIRRNPRIDRQLKRLRTDPQLRATAIMMPNRTLSKMNLKSAEKEIVHHRLKLLKRVGMGMTFELMRYQKSLRPLLLDPSNVNDLLFSNSKKLQNSMTPSENAQISRLLKSYHSISRMVMGYESQLGLAHALEVDDITTGARPDINNDDVDFVCATDQGCLNAGCIDSGCGDKGCTNGGCTNLGCEDEGCDNGSCTNDLCENTKNCENNIGCSDDNKQCIGGLAGLSDDFYDELARILESAIDRGPEMGFLVHTGGKTIPGKTFLSEPRLKKKIPGTELLVKKPNRNLRPANNRLKK